MGMCCIEALLFLFQGYCLQYFLGGFLESRWHSALAAGAVTAVGYAVFRMLFKVVFPLPLNEISDAAVVGRLAFRTGLVILSALCVYKSVRRITCFLTVTFLSVSEISFFLAYMVLRLGTGMMKIWTWCFGMGYIDSTPAFLKAVEVTGFLSYSLMGTVEGFVLYLSLKGIEKSFQDKEWEIGKTELLFLMAPAVAGFFICVFLRIVIVNMENRMPTLLYDRHPVLELVVPLLLLVCLASIQCGVKLFQDMRSLGRERNEKAVLVRQMAGMQAQMSESERIYAGLRSMKHDMRNIVSVLWQLSGQQGQDSELESYLGELMRTMEGMESRFETGSRVADILLNMKYHEAVRDMPKLRMETEALSFPGGLLIENYDIGIILGNALDNAVEGCRSLWESSPGTETYICVSSFVRGKMFFLEVENSFDGCVLQKAGTEFPVTKKPDRGLHGIGLINIRKTAEKYHGAVDWNAKGGRFVLTVMMKNEKAGGTYKTDL